MTLASSFLILSLIGLSFSVISYCRFRLPGPLMIVQFAIGWLVGELALQVIVGQALVSLFFIMPAASSNARLCPPPPTVPSTSSRRAPGG